MKDNIIYNQSCIIKELQVVMWRHQLLTKVLELDMGSIRFPETIIIYGAGDIGKNLYMRIKTKCNVICFIDRAAQNGTYDSIPVYNLEEFSKTSYLATIVVTPLYDYVKIKTRLKEIIKGREMDIRPIDDFL